MTVVISSIPHVKEDAYSLGCKHSQLGITSPFSVSRAINAQCANVSHHREEYDAPNCIADNEKLEGKEKELSYKWATMTRWREE